LSRSDEAGFAINRFDDWIADEFERTGGFTALVVLVSIGPLEVLPLRSTYMHVIGDEIDWSGFSGLMGGAGVEWDGVVFVPHSRRDGGPVTDDEARAELQTLGRRIVEDRMVINEGHFFDRWGRRMRVEEARPQ